MAKKWVLWTFEGEEDRNVLLSSDDIEKLVSTYENAILIDNVSVDMTDELTAKLRKYESKIDDHVRHYDDLETFFEEIGIDADLTWADEFEEARDCLIWDTENREFANLNDWEESKVYRYWDGSNHKSIEFNNALMTETIIETEDERCDTETGNTWRNNYYNVVSIDGKQLDEPQVLVEELSFYQGDLPRGNVVETASLGK